MSQGLRHLSKKEKLIAIRRRLNGKSKGLGYWAAVDDASCKPREARKHKEKSQP